MFSNFESQSTKDYFIISDTYEIKENSQIEFLNFYVNSKKANFTLTTQSEKLYICLKLDHFGSTLNGNYIYEQPNILLIKEIDPLFILIEIIWSSTRDNPDKFMKIEEIISKYKQILSEEHTPSNMFFNFLNDYLTKDGPKLEKICEKSYVEFLNENYYRLTESKVLSFLNSKIGENINENEICSILISFVPDKLGGEFLKFKNLNFEEKKENDNHEQFNHSGYKRRKKSNSQENEKSEIKKKKNIIPKVKPVEVDKAQKSIMGFFQKKN